jgi:hypothetical protein
MIKPLVILCVLALASGVQAQSTAFTYQGELKDGAGPAEGRHDFRFRLFDAASGGTQAGTTQCADNIQVRDGVFTTAIDFGRVFETTGARFMEIEVRRDTGLNCSSAGGFVILAPRQLITAAPSATHAFTAKTATIANAAFALSAPDGSPANAVFVDNDGRVGVGTSTPGLTAAGTKFDVVGGPMLVSNFGDQADLLWLASERSWVFRQEGTGAGSSLKLQSVGGGGNKHFIVQTDGLVGIGTTLPTAKLDVAGNARITGPLSIANSQINLLSPVTRTYSIHHYDLAETDLGTGGTFSRTDSGLSVFGNLNEFACGVHLPDGATIIFMEATGRDGTTSVASDITVTLGRTSFGGVSSTLASVNSGVGGSVWTTSSIASPVVNNNTHAYWVKVRLGGGFAPFDNTFFGMRILYQVSSPLP